MSRHLPHLNWFGGDVTMPDYGRTTDRAMRATCGTRPSHRCTRPAAWSATTIPSATAADRCCPPASRMPCCAKVAKALLPTSSSSAALGCDLLEVGYNVRGGLRPRASHRIVGQSCPAMPLFLTGNGIIYDHYGQNWYGITNNWFTSAWPASTDTVAPAGSFERRSAWSGSLAAYRGALDMMVDGSCPMGSVSAVQRDFHTAGRHRHRESRPTAPCRCYKARSINRRHDGPEGEHEVVDTERCRARRRGRLGDAAGRHHREHLLRTQVLLRSGGIVGHIQSGMAAAEPSARRRHSRAPDGLSGGGPFQLQAMLHVTAPRTGRARLTEVEQADGMRASFPVATGQSRPLAPLTTPAQRTVMPSVQGFAEGGLTRSRTWIQSSCSLLGVWPESATITANDPRLRQDPDVPPALLGHEPLSLRRWRSGQLQPPLRLRRRPGTTRMAAGRPAAERRQQSSPHVIAGRRPRRPARGWLHPCGPASTSPTTSPCGTSCPATGPSSPATAPTTTTWGRTGSGSRTTGTPPPGRRARHRATSPPRAASCEHDCSDRTGRRWLFPTRCGCCSAPPVGYPRRRAARAPLRPFD